MVSTRELRADYKIGPPGWQSQNRRAGVGEKTGQFKGLSGRKGFEPAKLPPPFRLARQILRFIPALEF
jgi:hypothetical protein